MWSGFLHGDCWFRLLLYCMDPGGWHRLHCQPQTPFYAEAFPPLLSFCLHPASANQVFEHTPQTKASALGASPSTCKQCPALSYVGIAETITRPLGWLGLMQSHQLNTMMSPPLRADNTPCFQPQTELKTHPQTIKLRLHMQQQGPDTEWVYKATSLFAVISS